MKDGIKLRNKSKKMTEKCQLVEVATDAWLPECWWAPGVATFSLSDRKHL